MKIFDDDSDEHVKHEEANEQQERDEVEQTPLVVVLSRLPATIHYKTVQYNTAQHRSRVLVQCLVVHKTDQLGVIKRQRADFRTKSSIKRINVF